MRVVIAYDRGYLRRWHVWLAEALRQDRHTVTLSAIDPVRPYPKALALLQSLEQLLYRRRGECASDLCSSSAFSGASVTNGAAGECDLIIDLSSGMSAAADGRVLAPLYDGVADELAAADAFLNGELVDLAIFDSARAAPVWHGRPASEDRNVLSKSLDNAFCRAGSLLARAVDQPPITSETETRRSQSEPFSKSGNELTFLVTRVSAKASALLDRLCGRGHEWGVAWRQTRGAAVSQRMPKAALTFQRLPNNPGSYFADPFLIARDGRHYLFAEEYLRDAGKGVISLLTIENGGSVSPSRVVLDRPYHLSYPFVFERDGEVYMIPESCAVRRVELYRAERFPDVWSLHSVLIDNIAASDATLCEHEGRLWLFLTTAQWQSSSWDTLEIYHAHKLEGPWTAVGGSPVLIDPDGTRPGGAMYRNAGELWRPAQDSTETYGGRLALCRVDELSPDRYRQTTISHLAPLSRQISGIHTLNCARGLEVIDVCGTKSSEPVQITVKTAGLSEQQL